MIGVVYGYYVKHGGIGRYLSNVFQNMSQSRKLELITLEGNMPLPKGVCMRVIECERDKSFLSYNENSAFSQEVDRVSENYDFLHSHGIYSFSPRIYTAHICFKKYSRMLREFGFETPLAFSKMEDLEEKMIKDKKVLTAVSGKVANEIVKSYGVGNIKVIRGASRFDEGKFMPRGDSKHLTFGFIGGNLKAKGVTFCNDTLNELKRRGLQVKLVGAGTNDEIKDYLESNAHYELDLRGKIEIDETFYRGLDAYLVLGIYEAYSLSTIEAMSLGVPVVSSDLNGVFFDAKDKNLLRVKDVTDTKEVADQLERVSFDEEYRERIVNEGFEIANQENWSDIASRYEEIYKDF